MAVQKRVPVSELITYVEFTLSDPKYPFVAASAASGGQVVLQEFIPRSGGEFAEFFSVMEVDPDELLALASDRETLSADLVARHDDGALVEFVVSDDCPAVFLGEQGALPRDVNSVDGQGRIAAEVPADRDASAIVRDFLEEHPDAELVSKRQQSYTTPVFSHREFQEALGKQLTDRQSEALTAAHEAGYYAWPREVTAEALAESLGISPATFTEHLRAAEQKLVAMAFESSATGTIDDDDIDRSE